MSIRIYCLMNAFDYFLSDKVSRDSVISANLSLVKYVDELWAFSPISDGVLAEIKLAKRLEKRIRFFEIRNNKEILEINS